MPQKIQTTLYLGGLVVALSACGIEKKTSDPASMSTSDTTMGTPTGTAAETAPTTAPATSTGETSLDTTGADLTCPDHVTTDACCCFEENRDDRLLGFHGTRSVCGAPPLCPPIELDCQDYPCPDDKLTTTDAVNLDCVLKALAQGDAGRVEWQINFGLGIEVVQYDLVGDATTPHSPRRSQSALMAKTTAVSYVNSRSSECILQCVHQALHGDAEPTQFFARGCERGHMHGLIAAGRRPRLHGQTRRVIALFDLAADLTT